MRTGLWTPRSRYWDSGRATHGLGVRYRGDLPVRAGAAPVSTAQTVYTKSLLFVISPYQGLPLSPDDETRFPGCPVHHPRWRYPALFTNYAQVSTAIHNAKWFVDFHPFASRALDELTYRQFNYARLMSHKSQLARWLNKVLCLKYLNASFLHPFEIRLSTIMRDSGLLSGYGRLRAAMEAVDSAFDELTSCAPPLLGSKPGKHVVQGPRGKILDVIYTLTPSREFVAEVKAASKRQSLAEDSLRLVDNTGAARTGRGE